MKNDYWDKVKRDVFPNIKDWKDPQDHIRLSNDVKGMTYIEWIFLHPSSYKLITWSALIIASLMFSFFSYYLLLKGIIILAGVALCVVLLMGVQMYKKYKKRALEATLTLYDLFMREYDEIKIEEVK